MIRTLIWATAPQPLKKIANNLQMLRLLLIPLGIIAVVFITIHFLFLNKIYPRVTVSGVNIGGLTQEEAKKKLSTTNFPSKLVLEANLQIFEVNTQEASLGYDIEKTVQKAYRIGHRSTLGETLKDVLALTKDGINLPFTYSLDTNYLDSTLETISHQLSIPAVDPEIIVQNQIVSVSTGKNGQSVDSENLKKQIFNNLAYAKGETVHIPITKLTPQISDDQAQAIKAKAQNLVGKQIKLTFEDSNFVYKDSDLLSLLQPIQPSLSPNPDKITNLSLDIAKTINRSPQDAKLTFENGQVKEFLPAKDGISVKEEELSMQFYNSLDTLETTQEKLASIAIPVEATKPDVATSEVNNLGIKELIGRGESYYKGSIASRIHNLSLATSRLNGTLIKPGEEFSFNKAVGEISQLTGYQQAYVIKEGRTILDDGGGVCQVSTTFFRTVLNSGLPILERHQHSYRVSYYEQGTKLGIDAAIYQPGIDLRLKNDTPANILIVTKNDTKTSHLVFEFYGTADGRVTEISNIRSWDPVPAPPDLYQDDPTLPVGQTKQLEHSIPGIKAAFDYKVTRNGETLQNRTFYSNYKAWQAVYLRGTLGQ